MFTMAKQIAAAQTSMVPYIAAGIFYYVFNLLVAMIMEKIEEKLNYYHQEEQTMSLLEMKNIKKNI